eukprot:14156537-Alexandrium_andersonii.AAC.1
MTRRPSITRSAARSSCAICRRRCASAWPPGAATGARPVVRWRSSCRRRRRCSGWRSIGHAVGHRLGRSARR